MGKALITLNGAWLVLRAQYRNEGMAHRRPGTELWGRQRDWKAAQGGQKGGSYFISAISFGAVKILVP